MTAGTRRLPRRGQQRAVIQPTEPAEVPMKPQQQTPPQQAQPVQPPVVVDDTTLAVLWQPYDEAIERAKAAATLAAPLEQAMTRMRADAKHHRENADQLIAEAARLEAEARQAELDAERHRQDEDFHAGTAAQVANTVGFLAATNRRTHPAEKAKRDQQMAAANAAAKAVADGDPLTSQVGVMDRQSLHLPPSDNTAPLAAAGEQM